MVDTSDEWITTRTGIKERRIAAKNEFTSDLGAQAALRAMQCAGVTAEQIDLIIVATITPDMLTTKRPAGGIEPDRLDGVVGCRAAVDIAADTVLTWEMVQ